MPTYEYVCSKCEHHFEKYQPITDKALTVCPKDLCPRKPWGKGKVKHVIGGGGGLIFKGSGFYTTDYRSESYKAAAKKDSNAASSASAKSEKNKSAPASSTPSTSSTPKPKSD